MNYIKQSMTTMKVLGKMRKRAEAVKALGCVTPAPSVSFQPASVQENVCTDREWNEIGKSGCLYGGRGQGQGQRRGKAREEERLKAKRIEREQEIIPWKE